MGHEACGMRASVQNRFPMPHPFCLMPYRFSETV